VSDGFRGALPSLTPSRPARSDQYTFPLPWIPPLDYSQLLCRCGGLVTDEKPAMSQADHSGRNT